MLDPVTGAGLASSIITFIEFSYKVGKRAHQLSSLFGELPPDLQSCKDLVDVLARSSERLKAHITTDYNGQPILGPATAGDSDLKLVFDNCTENAATLLAVFEEISESGTFVKALKSVRKDGKIQRVRNDLEQWSITILQILAERTLGLPEELRILTNELKRDLIAYHATLESQMTTGLQELKDGVHVSTRDLSQILATQSLENQTAQLQLLAGQQDLVQNLSRMTSDINDMVRHSQANLANRMEHLLTDQQVATTALLSASHRAHDQAMFLQLQQLSENLTTAVTAIERLHSKKKSSPGNGSYHHQLEFEFSFRSEIVSIHIKRCTDWVSSSILFPPSNWSFPQAIRLPVPHFGAIYRCRKPFGCPPRIIPKPEAVNIMISAQKGRYHLIQVNLAENHFGKDILTAITREYVRYKGPFWSRYSLKRIRGVQYIKYDSYSVALDCFLSVQHVQKSDPVFEFDKRFDLDKLSQESQTIFTVPHVPSPPPINEWARSHAILNDRHDDPVALSGYALLVAETWNVRHALGVLAVFATLVVRFSLHDPRNTLTTALGVVVVLSIDLMSEMYGSDVFASTRTGNLQVTRLTFLVYVLVIVLLMWGNVPIGSLWPLLTIISWLYYQDTAWFEGKLGISLVWKEFPLKINFRQRAVKENQIPSRMNRSESLETSTSGGNPPGR